MAEVSELSPEAVARAVAAYRGGYVERDQHAFIPNPAELAIQARKWQSALDVKNAPRVAMITGLVSVDFGHGSIDLRGKTAPEQDEIMRSRQMPQTRIAGVNLNIKRISDDNS